MTEYARIHHDPTTVEHRSIPMREVRMSGDGNTLTGYAALFNSNSHPMPYTESIEPGAFTRSIADGDEVLALVDHDSGKLLARRSANTLKLSEDGAGLAFEIDIPNTQLGNDVREQVNRGDLKSMSFAFALRDETSEEWTRGDDGRRHRRLSNLVLYDVSVVSTPAYPETSVSTRSTLKMSHENTKMDEVRRLHAEMRSILDGEMSAEDQQKYDRLEERLSECETEIRTQGRRDALARAQAILDEPQRPSPAVSGSVTSSRESRAYTEAFNASLQGRATYEQRDMLTSGSSGGAIVPENMEASILEMLDDPTTMRGMCDVIQASGDVAVPVETALGGGGWIAEGGSISTADVTIEKKTATPKTYSTGIVWSFQQAVQSVVNVEQYFGRAVGRRLSLGLNAGYISGSGSSNEPEGIVTALGTPTYMNLASEGADAVIDAAHGLGASYRVGARWVMNDATLKTLRKMKVNSTDDAYVWQPSDSYSDIEQGTPGLLYGYPVHVDEDMPDTQMIFGNMARAYRIYDFGPTQILADPYSGAGSGLTKLWAYRLTDGLLVDSNAAKLFDTDAS